MGNVFVYWLPLCHGILECLLILTANLAFLYKGRGEYKNFGFFSLLIFSHVVVKSPPPPESADFAVRRGVFTTNSGEYENLDVVHLKDRRIQGVWENIFFN